LEVSPNFFVSSGSTLNEKFAREGPSLHQDCAYWVRNKWKVSRRFWR